MRVSRKGFELRAAKPRIAHYIKMVRKVGWFVFFITIGMFTITLLFFFDILGTGYTANWGGGLYLIKVFGSLGINIFLLISLLSIAQWLAGQHLKVGRAIVIGYG
jgi:hypothetical protein